MYLIKFGMLLEQLLNYIIIIRRIRQELIYRFNVVFMKVYNPTP